MTTSVGPRTLPSSNEELLDVYRRVRAHSLALAAPLSAEDAAIQSMPDASPTKWHLAHTTWFFETFVLLEHHTNFQCFHEHFGHLFNSYYNSVGSMFARPNRGLLSRPSLPEVLDYRAAIDAAMESLLAERSDELRDLVVLGLNHEQQHQELLLTDFKHVLSLNPLRPVYRTDAARPAPLPHDAPHDAPHDVPLDAPLDADTERTWLAVDEGLHWIGHDGTGFAFDNEGPRHRVFLEACEVAATPVTNGEYTLFIDDGGYQNPLLWLSDGWACSSDLGWSAPMYWERQNDEWFEFTLGGLRAVDPSAPVTHLSHYEADAFATWSRARLPSEAEWETVANQQTREGNFVEDQRFHPAKTASGWFGNTWEWTASPYVAYPGFEAASGALGEYNGKFMANQMVLRGGSCATSRDHVRATYRNFFPAHTRWQFSGLRLARNTR